MPQEAPARSWVQRVPDIVLPPPFTLVRLREVGDAFAHAKAIASEQGAGTLVYVGRFDLAEFALVLEPEEPLWHARRAFYAGMAALAETLAAQAQPETSVTVDWPDSISVNGGVVGGGRLAWQGADENAPPDWLVFGAMIRTVSMSNEPGLNPLVTALEEEGFTDVLSDHVIESFARHFMFALDAWTDKGFGTVAKSYLERLPRASGVSRDIGDNGDLLIRHAGKPEAECQALLPRLATPSWYDPVLKGPRT
jgi:hypothetical protein